MARFSFGSRAALVIVFALANVTAVHAGATPAQKCAITKQKAALKKLAAKLTCNQKAIKAGGSVDASCIMAAESKFNAAVMKAETKGGCVGGNDGAIENEVNSCVSSIVNLTPTVACQAAKFTCQCGSVTVSFTPSCGSASADCGTARQFAIDDCSANHQPAGDCPTVTCADACTGQPCG